MRSKVALILAVLPLIVSVLFLSEARGEDTICRSWVVMTEHGPVTYIDPNVCDTVRVGGSSPLVGWSTKVGDSVRIPVYAWHDEVVKGLSLGFSYNSDFVEITSFDTTGSILPPATRDNIYLSLHPAWHQFLFGWYDITGSNGLQPTVGSQGELLITLNARILPGFTSSVVDLDSVFVPPVGYFALSTTTALGYVYSLYPLYADCGRADLVLGEAHSPCGDANCDSTVDISDVVYLIAYIFSGGQAPCAGCK